MKDLLFSEYNKLERISYELGYVAGVLIMLKVEQVWTQWPCK